MVNVESIRTLFQSFYETRKTLFKKLENVPAAVLHRCWTEGCWSITERLQHILQAEDCMIRQAVYGKKDLHPLALGPQQKAKEQVAFQSVKDAIDGVHKETKKFLDELTPDHLKKEYTLPWGSIRTGEQLLIDLVIHDFMHQGQIYLLCAIAGHSISDM